MIVGGQFKTNDMQNYTGGIYSPLITSRGDQINSQKAAFQNYNAQLLYKKTSNSVINQRHQNDQLLLRLYLIQHC